LFHFGMRWWIGVPLCGALQIIARNPPHRSQNATADTELVIQFDEPVKYSAVESEVVLVVPNDEGSAPAGIRVGNSAITSVFWEGDILRIKLPSTLREGTTYQVFMDAWFLLGESGSGWDGIALGDWEFLVADLTAPELLSVSPQRTKPGTTPVVMRFAEDVIVLPGAPQCSVTTDDGERSLVPWEEVVVDGAEVTITTLTLEPGDSFAIIIPARAFGDRASNPFMGFRWAVSVVSDFEAPVLQGVQPQPGGVASPALTYRLNFNEVVQAQIGSGNIRFTALYPAGTPTVTVTDDTELSTEGNQALVTPRTILVDGAIYELSVTGSIFADAIGNPAAPIPSGYRFEVQAPTTASPTTAAPAEEETTTVAEVTDAPEQWSQVVTVAASWQGCPMWWLLAFVLPLQQQ